MSKPKGQYRKYDATYKAEVLRQVASGASVSEVAKNMGISDNLIHTWRSKEKNKHIAQSDNSVLAQELEQARLKLKQVEMERDILKKALSICNRTP